MRMTGWERVVFTAALIFRLLSVWGNDAASMEKKECKFNESCVLPCSFPESFKDPSLLIHWIIYNTEIHVHSYYDDSDQFAKQDQHFRNRTSLFKDQIPNGNASLQLERVKVQDNGTYKCYISRPGADAQTTFIELKVDAPVRKVDIQQAGDEITCSSEGIYPKPELTWTTWTPQTTRTLQTTSSVQKSDQLLYSIRSSLVVADQNYSCTVSTPTSQRRATWFLPTSINSPNSEVNIRCRSTKTPLTGLVWRFNLTDLILDQTRTNTVWGDRWRQKVEADSESGSLTLRPPLQEGMYTCEVSDEEETYVTNHLLRVQDGPGSENGSPQCDCQDWKTAAIVLGIFLAVVVVVVAIAVICYFLRRGAEVAGQEDGANGQGAGAAGQGTGAAGQRDGAAGQGAGATEQGAGATGQGAGAAGQGAGATEQGAGATEQGAGATGQGDGAAGQRDGAAGQGDGAAGQGDGAAGQGTGATEQGAGATGQGAGAAGQRDGATGQGTGATGQGTGAVGQEAGANGQGIGAAGQRDGAAGQGAGATGQGTGATRQGAGATGQGDGANGQGAGATGQGDGAAGQEDEANGPEMVPLLNLNTKPS